MRRLASCVILMATLALGRAQGPSVETVIEERNGRTELNVINRGEQPVTALVITLEHGPASQPHRGTLVDTMDTALNITDRPIMPGDTRTFAYGAGPGVSAVAPRPGWHSELALQAAIFADGSTFGDPDWAQRLIDARRSRYKHLGGAIQALHVGRETGKSKPELIAEFQELEKGALASVHGQKWPNEMLAIRWVYDTVLLQLQQGPGPGGTPTPLDAVLNYIIQELMQQRQRLLASKPPVTENESGE
jgi:hypothetical protein